MEKLFEKLRNFKLFLTARDVGIEKHSPSEIASMMKPGNVECSNTVKAFGLNIFKILGNGRQDNENYEL